MSMHHRSRPESFSRGLVTAIALWASATALAAGDEPQGYTFEPGHASLQEWLLPENPPFPEGNAPTAERAELGKMLFFDPRVGGDGNMSCASCHNPVLGWSDGLPTARGHRGRVLGRATPTITNSAYNFLQMWDGRKASLEDQALGPMEADVEMNTDLEALFVWLQGNPAYRASFERAYPGEPIGRDTVAKAIASFERTVVVRETAFDRWVAGDPGAMTPAQVRGFEVFTSEEKGNCATCHSAPNFTDDSFHNLGLASAGAAEPDLGRFSEKPIERLRGAFKTPSLRDIARTAPYFHDGSAATLEEVVEHYVRGGVVTTHLSSQMRPLDLTASERADLIAFMHALTAENPTIVLPALPIDRAAPETTREARETEAGDDVLAHALAQ